MRPEKVLFSKYKFVRVREGGKLIGGVCLSCNFFRVNCSEDRLEEHFRNCTGEETDLERQDDMVPQNETPKLKRRKNCQTPLSKRMKLESPTLKNFFDSCSDLQSLQIKKKLVSFAIFNEISFEAFDGPHFQKLLEVLRPSFNAKLTGSQELYALIPDIYKDVLESSIEKLKDCCTMKLTVDKTSNTVLVVTGDCVFVGVRECLDGKITNEVMNDCVSIALKINN